MDRKSRDLVRLALFTENRRAPLRREEISKKGTYVLSFANIGNNFHLHARSTREHTPRI